MDSRDFAPDADSFDDFLNEELQDPAFAAAFEDAAGRARLVESLKQCRSAQKLRQADVAAHMGVGQSVVSQFENADGDVYFSTLQRYARAVGARLAVRIELPAEQGWAPVTAARYVRRDVDPPEATVVQPASNPYLQVWARQKKGEPVGSA